MVVFVLGVPGSGKSYWGVNFLYDTFKNDKSSQFGENIKFYTNIDNFVFTFFPDGVGLELDFDDLKSKLVILHDLKIIKKVKDDYLQEKAKELELLNVLFVIDEAHNFFDKKDPVLVWWLSYHRHLHQNVILLTQNLSLIESKYKAFSENFYQALPSSLRIISSVFRYRKFVNSRMAKDHRAGTVKLKFNAEVYKLYHSGANTQGSKVVWKFFGIAIFAALAFVLAIYLVKQKWSPKEPEKNETFKTVAAAPALAPQNNNTAPALPPKSYEDIRLLCGDKSCVAYGVTLTNADVENLKRKYQLHLLSNTPFTADFSVYVYRSNKSGVINEILAGTN